MDRIDSILSINNSMRGANGRLEGGAPSPRHVVCVAYASARMRARTRARTHPAARRAGGGLTHAKRECVSEREIERKREKNRKRERERNRNRD